MKNVYILLLAMIYAGVVYGQDKAVAVLDPRVIGGGTVSSNDKVIIKSSMKKAFTQVNGYEAYSRTAQSLFDAEAAFQRSGHVDESQIKAVGKQTGVAYICVFTLSKENNELVVNSDILNVVTGKIENSDFVVLFDVTDRENVAKQCQALAYSLLGVNHTGATVSPKPSGGSLVGNRRNGEVCSPDGIELVYVEGTGSGVMATKGFYIGKYEVTQAQWRAIMGSNPSNFRGDNLPVETVSWNEVQEFLTQLNQKTGRNYRLPTEAEWEFAARGGNKSRGYEYSGSNDVGSVAWYDSKRTQPVGTKTPNELGIYDMSGNVWEWCEDADGSYRVYRGGGWHDGTLSYLSVTGRYSSSPNYRNDFLGFRVVLP
ncbi:MAG: formylglycine-generating enzyme family protein [Bacteroidales bacterium]|nr:formylglycine-generating enzyme family protein [Bacteroidales bacterium]